jgi:hypothetical protein
LDLRILSLLQPFEALQSNLIRQSMGQIDSYEGRAAVSIAVLDGRSTLGEAMDDRYSFSLLLRQGFIVGRVLHGSYKKSLLGQVGVDGEEGVKFVVLFLS